MGPLIVRGGGGCAPEPRQDVAEAVVAVQFGLALGALDGALEAAAEEALEQGRLDALPVHEAPGRGVRGRRAAPQGEVVMVVAVAVVTQR